MAPPVLLQRHTFCSYCVTFLPILLHFLYFSSFFIVSFCLNNAYDFCTRRNCALSSDFLRVMGEIDSKLIDVSSSLISRCLINIGDINFFFIIPILFESDFA